MEVAEQLHKADRVFVSLDCQHAAECVQLKLVDPEELEAAKIPTVGYFKNGKYFFHFTGYLSAAALADFVENPNPYLPPINLRPSVPALFSAEHSSDGVHFLTASNYSKFLQNNLECIVLFYSPWCQFSQEMKPVFVASAKELPQDHRIKLAVLDCAATGHAELCVGAAVAKMPSLHFFQNGAPQLTYEGPRDHLNLMKFLTDPSSVPPSQPAGPPPFLEGDTRAASVVILDDASIEEFLGKNKFAFVFFFAPWCGYCQQAKPAWVEAASNNAKDQSSVYFAARSTVVGDRSDSCFFGRHFDHRPADFAAGQS